METDSYGYSLGTEVFPSRSEAIKSLSTDVVDEFQSYEAQKKVVDRNLVEEDDKLTLIDNQISINLRHCLALLVSFQKDGNIPIEESSKILLDNFFKKSGRTVVVSNDQFVDNAIEKTHTLLVITRSLKELESIVKEFVPIKTVSLELAASLLRKRNRVSGVNLIQKILRLYVKASQIPGFKEWRDKNNRYNNSSELRYLESLGKPRIIDIFLTRGRELKTRFSWAVAYLASDLNDYSRSLVKPQ